jgi:hypothetical protein
MFDFFKSTSAVTHTPEGVLYTVLIAFLLSTLIAVTYEKTFRGLSYSRNFVQTIVLGSVVAATVLQAVGDSLARGLGMLGALAIIRFRTSFRDPRDIIFIFAALAAGIACGVYAYMVAILGSLLFCAAAVILHFSPFGRTNFFDGMLRFSLENSPAEQKALEAVLASHCRPFVLVTLREAAQGKRLDYAYHFRLQKGIRHEELVTALGRLGSLRGLALQLQETTIEL